MALIYFVFMTGAFGSYRVPENSAGSLQAGRRHPRR
jgi:hypothetical protein